MTLESAQEVMVVSPDYNEKVSKKMSDVLAQAMCLEEKAKTILSCEVQISEFEDVVRMSKDLSAIIPTLDAVKGALTLASSGGRLMKYKHRLVDAEDELADLRAKFDESDRFDFHTIYIAHGYDSVFGVDVMANPAVRPKFHHSGSEGNHVWDFKYVLFNWWFLFFVPLSGYALAWYDHFYVEQNIPATFGHPVWSLLCDSKMFVFMITGQMDREIKRLVWSVSAPNISDTQMKVKFSALMLKFDNIELHFSDCARREPKV
ncbi:hypothetical protein CTI12_AA548970 [Artemisia annua]|uniref:Uncharacterized protein n=1 Tax=Artemisia annua TaxID=35608 RepID=A0A2U1KYZ8_ARTAN|nr:hypothetical protein CTI12_AA548970 [Artemisia annua]